MKVPVFIAGVIAGCAASSAYAFDVPTSGPPNEGIEAKVRSPFSTIPPTGYYPVRIEVTNKRLGTERFRARLIGRSSYGRTAAREDVHQLEVPGQSDRQFDLLVPVPPASSAGYSPWCSAVVEFTGGGFVRREGSTSGRTPGVNDAHRPTIGFGVSLPTPEAHLEGAVPGEIYAITVEPSLLSGDWRALAGLDALWVTPTDVEQMSSPAHRALLTWLAAGGELVWVDADGQGLPLGLGPEDFEAGHYGLGRLRRLTHDTDRASHSADVAGLLSSLRARVIASEARVQAAGIRKPGSIEAAAPTIEVDRLLILGLLVVLAILIGPVNFFWLAPKAKRMRILWTTPLLSVSCSVVLVFVILLQDGLGGEGQRAQVVVQFPQLNLQHRWQVQSSRTGLIPFHGFDLPASMDISALPAADDDRDLRRDEGRGAGDWFRTRSAQAQLLRWSTPSRDRVTRVERGEGDSPPRLVSSLGFALGTYFFIDTDGAVYRGEGLAPGETSALQPATESAAWAWIVSVGARFPGNVGGTLQDDFPRRGWLFGEVAQGLDHQPTLSGIAWTDHPIALFTEVMTTDGGGDE